MFKFLEISALIKLITSPHVPDCVLGGSACESRASEFGCGKLDRLLGRC